MNKAAATAIYNAATEAQYQESMVIINAELEGTWIGPELEVMFPDSFWT